MKTENKYFDKVYSYLQGELNESENQEFLSELENNKELRNEFETQSSLNQLLNDKDTLIFNKKLSDVKIEAEKSEKNRTIRFIYSAAAVLVILVTTLVITKYYKTGINNDNLFAQYYEFNPSNEIVRGEIDTKTELSKGLIEYDLHNYENAITILNNVLTKDSLNVKAKFYLSLAYIETEKYNEAIVKLEDISTYKDHILIDQIKWYLALCYIKTDEKDKAIKEFTDLANSEYYCKNKAKEILEILQNNN